MQHGELLFQQEFTGILRLEFWNSVVTTPASIQFPKGLPKSIPSIVTANRKKPQHFFISGKLPQFGRVQNTFEHPIIAGQDIR